MKKILLLLLVFAAQNNFCSAQQSIKKGEIEVTEKNVSKKWVLEDIINPGKTKEQIAELKDMLSYVWLKFNEDKTYSKDFIIVIDGTWTLDKDKKTINTTDKKGKDAWTIHSLTKDRITLSLNDSMQKLVLKAG